MAEKYICVVEVKNFGAKLKSLEWFETRKFSDFKPAPLRLIIKLNEQNNSSNNRFKTTRQYDDDPSRRTRFWVSDKTRSRAQSTALASPAHTSLAALAPTFLPFAVDARFDKSNKKRKKKKKVAEEIFF